MGGAKKWPAPRGPYPVPENWRWVCWGACGKLTAGAGVRPQEQAGPSLPLYKVSSLKQTGASGLLSGQSGALSEEARIRAKAPLIPPNSILFAKIGEAIRLNRRGVNPKACCIDSNLMAFSPALLHWKYAYYWMLGLDLYPYSSASTVPALRKSVLEQIPVPVPPEGEQRRIAACLEGLFSDLDRAEQRLQRALESFEPRRAAVLHRAFTGELIGAKGVRQVPLGSVLDGISAGPFGSALHREEYVTGGVPVINPAHIKRGRIAPQETVAVSREKAHALSAYQLRENDMVLARRGDMGRCAPVSPQQAGWLCGTGCFLLRLKGGYSAPVYARLLASPEAVRYFHGHMAGATLQSLNETAVCQLPVPDFTAEQQQALGRALEEVFAREERAMDQAQAARTAIDAVKAAALTRAFHGRLGTNDPEEEPAAE